ncbi:MAG: 50S ribosomal protein L30 [Eubacterium sp.]|nr:50S ribosomal protein L30 [Eubacterium sp.]MCI8919854.1 50S ribosomal protein L30 [Eubacterium sp.]
MADKMLKVTLVRSKIGSVPRNRKIIESMGFRKLNQTKTFPDNECTKGALRKIAPYVKVEEVEI